MESVSLEQIIRQYVILPPYPNAKGWYPVLHTTCDHGKKGARAAFKFNSEVVTFNCFNCSHAAVFDPNQQDQAKPIMSKGMIKVMDDFSIPEDEWRAVMFDALSKRDAGIKGSDNEIKRVNIEPPVLNFPETFYPLKDADDTWATIARIYLEERNINPDDYNFQLARVSKDKPYLNKWLGRVILPSYKNGKLIFYQGRDLTGTKIKKYESPPDSRDAVLCGFDRLFTNYDQPLYIVEGWFDAEAIGGVAVLSNTLSEKQIAWLNRSQRTKVYIPDQYGSGFVGAKVAIKEGWHVSTPDIGNIKDMSSAVQHYGLMYVLKTLNDNTATGFEAETNIAVYCKK